MKHNKLGTNGRMLYFYLIANYWNPIFQDSMQPFSIKIS